MKRAFVTASLLFLLPLALLPGDVRGASPCSNSFLPPFIAAGVKPNILIILDNSNSMDEDFYGNAAGSYSSASKAVLARQALQDLVAELEPKADVGIMTYTLPGDVQAASIHNALPFASYDPNSYCANPPAACVNYCITGDATAESDCEAACPGLTTTTYATGTNFPDLILAPPPAGPYPFTTDLTSARARYCALIYPKTQRIVNPTDTDNYIYYKQPDPMYDSSNDGTQFGYCGNDAGYPYSTAEDANNTYVYRGAKTGTSDLYKDYDGSAAAYSFTPTDSDWALGFHNFGQRMPFYYVGPTWFSPSETSGSPQGYLHVPVGDLTNPTQYNNVISILNANPDDSAGYMNCSAQNKNNCPYIVDASNTPTAGTLLTALNYFNGNLSQGGTTYASPITAVCQKNYIIYVTDGLPDTMLNGSQPSDPSQAMPQVLTELGNLQTNVTQAFNKKTYTFPVKTYVLGLGLSSQAQANLDKMAVAGGTATASGHAYYASSAAQLTSALSSIAQDLLGRVAAGSSISILSEGQTQNGANILQGVFYPTKYFGKKTIEWPGYLYDYWFYNSQAYNNIREDTVHDFILELDQDYGLTFEFDPQLGLNVNRYSDPTGSGNPSVFVDNTGLDSLTPIWEAGKMLFQQSAASRVIYTPGNSSSGLVSFDTSNPTLTTPGSSPLGSPSTFDSCLQGSSNTETLQNLINYVRGTDLPDCRNRTVGLCSNGTAFNNTSCATDSDCTASPYNTCVKNVWKLGDIVYSTPRVEADYKYCASVDSSGNVSFASPSQACTQDSDCTTSPYTSCEKKESVVFVGANDGMLHAFKTGVLTNQGLDTSKHQISKFSPTGIPTSDMGKELWGFIPKNSLPYLRCLAVPPPNTCHLYYNDLSPYVTTMVSNGVTKKILIGGMRLGGGSAGGQAGLLPGDFCLNSSGASNGQSCSQSSQCPAAYNASCSYVYPTNVPADTCSGGYVSCANPTTCYNPPNCTGLSSYYAIDITDAENPKLLWEFSHPLLGYSYSGPAIIHKWADPATLSGDRYYVMFLSGPTNPADGSSIQNLQVFILSLDSNLKISSVYYNNFGSSIKNGFGGRLFTTGLDVNGDGYTDFVLFGYGYSPNGQTDDWHGGIGKINTNNIDPTAALDPKNWTYDVSTYSNIAQLPITAQVVAEKCFGTWYLYAGTGRYFFPLDDYGPSGLSGKNYIMGVPFTCDQYDNNCASINNLNNNTNACSALQKGEITSQAGWQYTLSDASGTYLRERMVTDPTISNGNKIYFTTSQPTSDPCGYGGRSRVWGLNCGTGAAILDNSCSGFSVSDLTGTLYLQTSTGAIYKIDAASSFNDASTGNRTTSWFIGMPPENSPPVSSPPASAAKAGQLIQWIEK